MRKASRVGGLTLAALAAVSSRAAEVDFRPSMTFGLFHDGNTAVVGNASGQSDYVGATAADLVVARRTADSSLSFSYRPTYVAYQNDSTLNYFGQSAILSYSWSTSRLAQYTFALNASRTEQQGVRPTSPSDAETYVPRSMQTDVHTRVHGTHQQRRSIVDWEVRGGLEKFSVPTLQDSTAAGALASWRYEVSEMSSVGLGLIIDAVFYDTLPDAYVESFGLVGARTFNRATSLDYAVGVSRTASAGASDTNLAANVALSRTITDVSSLSAGIRQTASPGSGLGGVSLDTGGFVSYTHSAPRPGLTGAVTAAYWRRDPIAEQPGSTTPSTNTISAVASIGWIFNRYLTLNFYDSYADQSSSDPAALDTNYNSYGFGLIWAIRGR